MALPEAEQQLAATLQAGRYIVATIVLAALWAAESVAPMFGRRAHRLKHGAANVGLAVINAAVAFAFVALNYWVYAHLGSREMIPERESFEHFPMAVEEWRCPERSRMDEETLEILGATDYLVCDYYDTEADDPMPVNLYLGYHATQVRDYGEEGDKVNSIHPPEHCLPGSGWDVIDSRLVPVESGELSGTAKRLVIAKGEHRQLVYFWYQSRGRIISRNHEVIFFKFLDRALQGRSDGALVRLTTPILRGDDETADRTLRDFAAAVTPHFAGHLPN